MLFLRDNNRKMADKRARIEEIILNNYNKYYRLALSYVHNAADAGDIVQNGAYNAIRRSDSLKDIKYAETWIYRIMLNECFMVCRRPEVISYEALEEGKTDIEVKWDTYADVDLLRALDGLNESDRAVVILKYFEDRTLEEISDILGENVNTIKSRLYRCMKKLKDVLSDDGEEWHKNKIAR